MDTIIQMLQDKLDSNISIINQMTSYVADCQKTIKEKESENITLQENLDSLNNPIFQNSIKKILEKKNKKL